MRAIIDRNLWTCISVCKEVAPEMMERKKGWIINVGSIAGTYGMQLGAVYGAAKAAVHNYSRSLAGMLRPYGICVNVVAPGGTLSPRYKASRRIDEERLNSYGSLVRYAWPREIAMAVEFLVSDAAAHISGQVLRVDGAEQLWPG
jgi:3-oxoacyl-[acyl-carrier protein] reductase